MNKIIAFLQDKPEKEEIFNSSIDKRKLQNSYNGIRKSIDSVKNKEKKIIQLKNNPEPEKGQIWLCKQKYFDAFGNEITGDFPYLVLIVSEVDEFANKNFVRIQPVSPFIEFAAIDDIIIKDTSVTGFEFIIETWNKQPVLIELLDEFVGIIDIEPLKIDEVNISLTLSQKEFRKAEIRNTGYLRQSVKSLIEFEELSNDSKILLNIKNNIYFPKPENKAAEIIDMLNEPSNEYLIAAKKGSFLKRPAIFFEEKINDINIKIKVIKDNGSFILSIKEPEKVDVINNLGKILKQSSLNLYDELHEGLYFIKIKGIDNEIRIILK